ncbi:hypothetical protein HD597_005370 [Nonomuraea thailandensis]|uniref:Uncharacterized protein n=1 Tax=Nonomuraea thailandensis TaxID=1188745 RepID=A0A9X2GIC2_9ACTN|nr:hypothetical protein [Nonomuraea thailandensis]
MIALGCAWSVAVTCVAVPTQLDVIVTTQCWRALRL